MNAFLRGAASGLLTLATALSLSAQTVDLGAKAGWVRPTFAGSDVQNASARNTVGGGAFLTVNVTPVFAFQPEVLYVAKGAQGTEEGMSLQLHLAYVEVPLLARLHLPIEGATVRPYVLAGPTAGFKSKCEAKATEGSTTVTMACDDQELQLQMRKIDWSLTGGAGLALPLGRLTGLVEARYDYGLTTIDESSSKSDVKNRAFMVFAGVSVPLGGVGRAAAALSH